MDILMRGKRIFRDTMEIEADTKITEEKIKWHNRRDDVYVLLCLIIPRDLFSILMDWQHQIKYGRLLEISLSR